MEIRKEIHDVVNTLCFSRIILVWKKVFQDSLHHHVVGCEWVANTSAPCGVTASKLKIFYMNFQKGDFRLK
ncbi:MAG: hypothetical protein RLZZ628_1776 [Bacteroidota bacterium]|jgi:hypothetical protein